MVILIITLFILLSTHNIFWVIVAAILLLAYSFAYTTRAASRGVKSVRGKVRDVYKGEMGELEKVTGKYPAKFFDSVGKGVYEKVSEYQAPKGAKSYKDALNYKWAITSPAEKIGEIASKIMDSLGKLFSK